MHYDKLHAVPNINGNTPQVMIDRMLAVASAVRALEAALATLHSDYAHGRNYQTLDNPDTLLHLDRSVICAAAQEARSIGSWATGEALRIHEYARS